MHGLPLQAHHSASSLRVPAVIFPGLVLAVASPASANGLALGFTVLPVFPTWGFCVAVEKCHIHWPRRYTATLSGSSYRYVFGRLGLGVRYVIIRYAMLLVPE